MLHAKGVAAAAGASATRRVAALPPKRALGRARRAVRTEAMKNSSFAGASLSIPASRSAPFRGQRAAGGRARGAVAVKAMFERFTEKAIKVVM
jgi:hypothetical protein